MPQTMNYSQRTKDELITELISIKKSFDEVREKYEREILQLHLAEEELRKSEEKFRKAFITSPDSININRLTDGMYISINSGFTKIMGYTDADVIGRTSIDLNIWKNPEDRKRLVEGLKAKGEVENLEAEFISKNGNTLFGLMSAAVIDLSGVQHILSITRDITEQKQAAIAIKESEEWFRKLFEQSNDGIFYLDPEGNIVEVNKAFAQMHGYTLDEIRSMNIFALDTEENKQQYSERMRRLINGENLKFEVDHLHKDGHALPLEVTAGLISIGSKNYLMSSHRDITEKRKAEEAMKFARAKAEASDRLKTSFLNNISHEVRTPLNGILGFSEILTGDTLSQDEREEAYVMVNECSNRLLDTITNVMDISLILSGEMSVNKKIFNPLPLLREPFEKYKAECVKSGIGITLDTTGISNNCMIFSDPELIQKVIIHLLNNAVKFTERGSVTIGCKEISGELEFFVSDTGIGIGAEALKDIFTYFVKEDLSMARSNEGSGLGLSISKGIIDLLGGKINVESVKGKGSVFSFSLPVMEISGNHEISNRDKPGNKKLSSILIAEDDEANYLYLKALLSQNTKAEIIYAVNGREAIEKFNLNRGVDIILMDMRMPVVDGFEATRSIKSIDPGVPVIAVTAYAMIGDERGSGMPVAMNI